VDVAVGLIGWVGVGLGGTYGCRCGVLYVPMLGVVFCAGVVSLTSSSYHSSCSLFFGTIVLGGVFFFKLTTHRPVLFVSVK